MKRAIVTGAAGFVGSWLIRELVAQHVEVIAVVRDESSNVRHLEGIGGVQVLYCGLDRITTLAHLLRNTRVDAFYHLAWEGTRGKARADYDVQLKNVQYACDAAVVAKRMGVAKFICTGTITEKIAERILDSGMTAENTIYGLAKHTTHCLLEIVCNQLNLTYVWAQLCNVYGSNNTSGNILSYAIAELLQGNRPRFSKAEQPYDFMYVEDVAKALFLLGEKQTEHSSYFVGSGQPRLLKEYLIDLADMFGQPAGIELGALPDDGLVYRKDWFDTSILHQDTGFVPEYSFVQGAAEILKESGYKERAHDSTFLLSRNDLTRRVSD